MEFIAGTGGVVTKAPGDIKALYELLPVQEHSHRKAVGIYQKVETCLLGSDSRTQRLRGLAHPTVVLVAVLGHEHTVRSLKHKGDAQKRQGCASRG